jgi:hypothetical protein
MTSDTITKEMMTLGDALPLEMARVRDELIPAYRSIGPSGAWGLLMLRASLDNAAKAMASGDIVAMMRAYKDLKESQ